MKNEFKLSINTGFAVNRFSEVDELADLYIHNDDEPPTRPLGEWPELEV